MRTARTPRPRTSRPTHRHGIIWTAFVILMMLFSMFSTLVDPALAQGDTTTDTANQAVDTDSDGILDPDDSCPEAPNLGTDFDGDTIDDACDPPPPPDSDGDGLTDADETNVYGTDPSLTDTDTDGLSDFDEVMTHGTNPNAPDTDGDGVNDDVEIANGTDPAVADVATEPDTGNVVGALYVCPFDYDPTTSNDRDTMRAACNLWAGDPAASWRVTPNGAPPIDAAPPSENVATFADLPIGATALQMLTPPDPAWIYCEGNIIGGGSNTKPYAFFGGSNNTVNFDLLANEEVRCDFFISAAPVITVVFHKYTCDYAYDTANKTHVNLRDDCRQPNGNVTFYLTGQQGYDQNQAAPQDQSPVTFGDIPAGDMTAWETIPPGYQFLALYCYHDDGTNGANGANGGPPAPWGPTNLDGQGRLPLGLQSGTFYCDWFNRAPQYDANYLVLYKHECVAGVQDSAPANASVEDAKAYYDAECPVVPDWDFDLEYPDGSKELKRTGADGMVVWEGIDIGTATVTETLPDDYGDPFVYCRYVQWPENVVNGEWAAFGALGGSASVGFEYDGMGMECHLYNLAPGLGTQGNLDQPSDLRINKRICPPGYDPTAQGVDPLVDCTMTAPDGITFTVVDTDPNTADIQSDTGDQSPGNSFVEFGGLTPGMHTITETQDPAYANAYLWTCEGYQNAVSMPVNTGWSYEMDVPSGADITCEWLNIPAPDEDGEGFSVTLYKWRCPAATMNDQTDPSYYDTECDTEHPGIPFTLTHGGTQANFLSDTMGEQVDNVLPDANGQFTLVETIPNGYLDPVGYCQPVNGSGGQTALLVGGTLTVTVPQDFDDDYHCWFYNIPENDLADLYVYKYLCPVGYDYTAQNADPMVDCTPGPNGVTFTLSDADPNTNDVITNTGDSVDYRVMFGGTEPGDYTLTETLLPSFASSFLWSCDGLTNGAVMPWSTTGSYDLTLAPGDSITCHWFNIPTEDGFSVTLYKYECPDGTMYGNNDPNYYSTECATQQPNIPFTLVHGGPQVDFMSDTNGHQVDNVIPDANGTFTLTELIQPGWGDPVGFCQPLNGPDGTPATLINGVLTVTVPADFDDDYQCWYYNIPKDPMSVTLYKWECPVGTAYGNPDPNYYSGECATEQPGVPFTITDGNGATPFMSDTNGHQVDDVVPTNLGQFILMEDIPDGYGDPVGLCQPVNGPDGTPMTLVNGILTVTVPPNFDDDWHCWYYNIPEDPGKVTIYKWDCPEGMEIEKTYDAHKTNCVTPLDTIEFTLEDSQGPRAKVTAGGVVEWDDVMIETITVAETIPLGYSPQPYVSCRFAEENAMVLAYSVYNGVLTATLNHGGQHIICDWFNQYEGPGEVTVYKWECPEGYDRNAWGADPATDCTTPYNGVTFVLDQPEGVDLQTDTGDSINGAVYFGGLMPGQYTLSEMVPEGIVDVFVLDCVGMDVAYVHPIPLSVGPNLSITVGAGDSIRCDWYNVPGYDPDYGWMTLTKYQCSTPKYVSDVDCLVYAGGQKFDLQAWNGSTWTSVQSGTTDASGKLTFMNLDPGTYRLTEPGKNACMIKSDRISSDGNLAVVADGGTTVKVYNCGSAPTTPKTPTKYPNTGVGPSGQDLRTMDNISLLGLLGAGAVISRRRLLGAAAVGAGTVALGRSIAAQPVLPLDAPATPDASPIAVEDCLFPATPSASAATPEGIGAGTPVACARGAVPVQMRIPVIDVDAPIEYLEFIEGQMEQPTGETNVAWYKNSARLGEQGNGIYAGHLNWWNVPQAVFYSLNQLREGDVIEIEGDDGEIYRYIVQWTQDFPSDEEPPEEALGHTDQQTVTVITCGGEWNAGRAEYDHRTLVRAVRDIEAFATPGT